jgi:hypothetical protein
LFAISQGGVKNVYLLIWHSLKKIKKLKLVSLLYFYQTGKTAMAVVEIILMWWPGQTKMTAFLR